MPEDRLDSGFIRDFQEEILTWYAEEGRDLPWRRTRDPYRILVSEMMLQQTQAERVIPKYNLFLETFPTPSSLAAAPLGDVLRLWSGLGYNRRAKYLWQIAGILCHPELDSGSLRLQKDPRVKPQDDDGNNVRHTVEPLDHTAYAWPKTALELAKLPGLGPYTASAITVFAYGHDEILLETNTRRIYQLLWTGADVSERRLHSLAERLLPSGRSADWHHALMDLGSLAKKHRSASDAQRFLNSKFSILHSLDLPVFPEDRVARLRQPQFEGSRRQIRGGVIKRLNSGPATAPELRSLFPDARLPAVLDELVSEEFIVCSHSSFHLA